MADMKNETLLSKCFKITFSFESKILEIRKTIKIKVLKADYALVKYAESGIFHGAYFIFP